MQISNLAQIVNSNSDAIHFIKYSCKVDIYIFAESLPPSPADTDSGTDSGISDLESTSDDKTRVQGQSQSHTIMSHKDSGCRLNCVCA